MAPNIGTTNLSLATANYLANRCLKATAYIELNATNEIRLLHPTVRTQACYGKKPASWKMDDYRKKSEPNLIHEKFRYMGIDFYPEATLRQLPLLLQQNYSYYILDFGVPNMYTFPEFQRCHLKYAVCSFSPWKQEQYYNFLRQFNQDNELLQTHVTILGNYEIKDKGNKNCKTIPFLPDPFQLTPGEFTFFDRLLERN